MSTTIARRSPLGLRTAWTHNHLFRVYKSFPGFEKKAVRAIAGIRQSESCKSHFKKFNLLTFPSTGGAR
ncbi:hypothetical protein J6590_047991 [Homalodisca vitripennis]|nr:hypothetical protein J6590_047991 [Homalodisca vitripennis]